MHIHIRCIILLVSSRMNVCCNVAWPLWHCSLNEFKGVHYFWLNTVLWASRFLRYMWCYFDVYLIVKCSINRLNFYWNCQTDPFIIKFANDRHTVWTDGLKIQCCHYILFLTLRVQIRILPQGDLKIKPNTKQFPKKLPFRKQCKLFTVY